MLPRLYVIVDRHTAETTGCGDVVQACIAAASAGARFFQIRDKGVSDRDLWQLADTLAVRLAGYGATVVINGRPDLALALGCEGVHRPQDGLPMTAIRRLVEHRLVGVSTHDAKELLQADEDGADFVTFSPIFETPSKPGAKPLGIAGLKAAAKLVDCPLYALGGVNANNAADCIAAGAHGVAVLSAIMGADNPYAATEELLLALEY